MAPPARQGAALKKNGGPDAGAIVNGILLYVENFPGLPSVCHYANTPMRQNSKLNVGESAQYACVF